MNSIRGSVLRVCVWYRKRVRYLSFFGFGCNGIFVWTRDRLLVVLGFVFGLLDWVVEE